MITEIDYLKAKNVVEKYKIQQKEFNKEKNAIIRKMSNAEDVDLTHILSKRAKTCLEAFFYYNNISFKESNKIHLSDLVLNLSSVGNMEKNKYDRKFNIIHFRNLGWKTYTEIMSFVESFL